MNNDEIDNHLVKMIENKILKNKVVRKQMYEKAAILRDIERTHERALCDLLCKDKHLESHNYKVCESNINKYLMDNYDISYNDVRYEDGVQFLRMVKNVILMHIKNIIIYHYPICTITVKILNLY